FSVTYRNDGGSAPAYVRVVIDGQPRAMTAASGSNRYRLGVRFAYATKLSAGRHRIRFVAMSTDGMSAAVGAGMIRVVATTATGSPSGSGGGGSGTGSTGDAPSGGSGA